MGKRLNIGLFVDDLNKNFTVDACKGAEFGAQAIDANLYIFPGEYLDPEETTDDTPHYEYQCNTVFSYASEKNLDVLYVMLGNIGCRTDFEKQKAFLEQFRNIPIVTLFTKMDGYSHVTFDNKTGFAAGIRHLIEDHGAEKIGFVSGPETNMDAMERLETFRAVMQEKGLPCEDRQIVYGDFSIYSDEAVSRLLKQNPDLQAVVFANDEMAVGGYRIFRSMDLQIGQDIYVLGFDNSMTASTMDPPLTTVEASPVELMYKAIVQAERFLDTKELMNLEIETHLVKRASCGCEEVDYDALAKRLGIETLTKEEEMDWEKIDQYLFGDNGENMELRLLKDETNAFLSAIHTCVRTRNFAEAKPNINYMLHQVLKGRLLTYTSTEKFFNTMISLSHAYTKSMKEQDDKLQFVEMFANFYRDLAGMNLQMLKTESENSVMLTHILNHMTGDILSMRFGDDIPYAQALQNVAMLGIDAAYLYTYGSSYTRTARDVWELPKYIYLSAFADGSGTKTLPAECQTIAAEDVFQNGYTRDDHRKTMVISPLYSGEELYGVMVSELSHENLKRLPTVTYQLSAALKSVSLISRQKEIQRELETSLERIKENNDFLSEISRSDELTGLYNRRGFLEYAQNAVISKKNRGKHALIAYSDMDNLKMINDKFGHDEGDFALREIASILRDTFRSTDVVGRFGGDEFVTFALVGVDNYEAVIKERIAEITKRHNELANKPYPIEMSTGIYEFDCNADLDLYEILDIADEKLYEEKNAKKAKYGSYR